jgi:glycosyltransferase involved in cell wall biosynthesis
MGGVLLDLTVLRTDSRERGIGRYVTDLARGLADLDAAEVRGVTELPWRGDADVRELRAGVAETTASPLRGYFDWAYRIRLRLASAARAERAGLVHLGHPNATPIGVRCPRLTTCHDLIPVRYPDHYSGWASGWAPGRRLLDGRRFRSPDHVLAVSEATASDLVRLLDVPARKITVVHNGVDLARWSAEPRPEDAGVLAAQGLAAGRYLLAVGAFEWRKNYEGTVAALVHARRRDADLRLVWVGNVSAEHKARLLAEADAAGARDAVVLPGFLDDGALAALYRHAYAHVFVSRCEGFGYPIVEAMASGCPVITSDCSSMAEIAGDAALTVDPEDAAAIGDAIVALDDAQERARLVAAGHARARRFSLERMAEETLALYRRLCA